MYSFPGDIVLDPFMGSGSVAAASKKFGRNYLGYDLNKKYVADAEKRLEGITDQIVTPEYRDKTVNRKELQEELF